MAAPTEVFRWWTVDQFSGERVLTSYKLTRAQAALAFTGAEPSLDSREFRHLTDLEQDLWGTTRPGTHGSTPSPQVVLANDSFESVRQKAAEPVKPELGISNDKGATPLDVTPE